MEEKPHPEKSPLPTGTRPAFPIPDVILSLLVLPHSPGSWILGMTQGSQLLLRASFTPLARLEMQPWTGGRDAPSIPPEHRYPVLPA